MLKKNISSIVILFFSFGNLLSQDVPSKKELKLYNNIYRIVIDSFLGTKPAHFVLIDSTDNREIQQYSFSEYLNHSQMDRNFRIDSNWINFLKDADKRKTALRSIKLQHVKSIHILRLFNRDSLFKIEEKYHFVGKGIVPPYGWVDGWMTISTPMMSKKKNNAIIQISCTRDELDGNGDIFLLEKRKNGKWVIVKHLRVSVS